MPHDTPRKKFAMVVLVRLRWNQLAERLDIITVVFSQELICVIHGHQKLRSRFCWMMLCVCLVPQIFYHVQAMAGVYTIVIIITIFYSCVLNKVMGGSNLSCGWRKLDCRLRLIEHLAIL